MDIGSIGNFGLSREYCNEYGLHLVFRTATRWQSHLNLFFLCIFLIGQLGLTSHVTPL